MTSLLIGLIVLLLIIAGFKYSYKPSPKQEIPEDECNYIIHDIDIANEITYDSYMNQLEWMFKMGIISVQEYEQYKRNGGIFLL